jgi:hypothetical protein
VTVVQRFGSALNLNLHFHCLVLDGVYVEDARTGALSWHRCGSPSTSDVQELAERIAWGCERWLGRQGYGAQDEAEDEDEDDALGVLQAAAVAGRSALSRARRGGREQVLGGRKYALPPRCASYGGYNLHAGVVVGAADRAGLQRLCRYVARPPLSASRLEVLEGGQVRVHLKRPWADGTAYISMTRLAFLERLASLVPPPRANTVLYHGVLASRSRLRERVRPPPPPPKTNAPPDRKLTRKPSSTSRWVPWARLLWRVFEVDGFGCPSCGQAMRLRAVVMPPATLRVLSSLGWSARGPPAHSSAVEA